MSSDKRGWTDAGLHAAARDALNAGLAGSALWSLLLGVMEQRARRKTPAELLEQWSRDRFVQPCAIDQRTLNELDAELLAGAEQFEALELAPLTPLGTCSVPALTSQNRIVSTSRGTEVVSDPTNVLALESVRRLREDPQTEVKLATSHRCTRAQPVPDEPGFAAHFRIFCLSSAAHERKDHAFLTAALCEHIRTGPLSIVSSAGGTPFRAVRSSCCRVRAVGLSASGSPPRCRTSRLSTPSYRTIITTACDS